MDNPAHLVHLLLSMCVFSSKTRIPTILVEDFANRARALGNVLLAIFPRPAAPGLTTRRFNDSRPLPPPHRNHPPMPPNLRRPLRLPRPDHRHHINPRPQPRPLMLSHQPPNCLRQHLPLPVPYRLLRPHMPLRPPRPHLHKHHIAPIQPHNVNLPLRCTRFRAMIFIPFFRRNLAATPSPRSPSGIACSPSRCAPPKA